MADIIVLNEITELLNSVNSGITSSLSTINSNVNTIKTNVASILDNTKANNTASTTGTLSQKISSAISNTAATTTENSSGTLSAKLTYLINRRNRGVKAGTTNFKTLASNLTTGTTSMSRNATQTVYSSYTSEFVVAYTGRYRAYCTGTVTVNTLYKANNEYPSAYNRMGFEIWVNGNTIASAVVATRNATTGTSEAVTKTLDITLEAGQVIKMRVYAQSDYYYVNCVGNYQPNAVSAACTDLSIRGTVVELTGNPII